MNNTLRNHLINSERHRLLSSSQQDPVFTRRRTIHSAQDQAYIHAHQNRCRDGREDQAYHTPYGHHHNGYSLARHDQQHNNGHSHYRAQGYDNHYDARNEPIIEGFTRGLDRGYGVGYEDGAYDQAELNRANRDREELGYDSPRYHHDPRLGLDETERGERVRIGVRAGIEVERDVGGRLYRVRRGGADDGGSGSYRRDGDRASRYRTDELVRGRGRSLGHGYAYGDYELEGGDGLPRRGGEGGSRFYW